MNLRVALGQVLALFYNQFIGRLPSRTLRRCYLKKWLRGLGTSTGVQMGCSFLNGRKITLGSNCVINFGSMLDGRKYEIHVGENVSIGPEATILTLGHDPQSTDFSDHGGDVKIGDRAWIAYRAVILPGVTIGEGAVVGAGALVTRDVEPFAIVAGNPAKKIGERNRDLTYRLNFHPWLG